MDKVMLSREKVEYLEKHLLPEAEREEALAAEDLERQIGPTMSPIMFRVKVRALYEAQTCVDDIRRFIAKATEKPPQG